MKKALLLLLLLLIGCTTTYDPSSLSEEREQEFLRANVEINCLAFAGKLTEEDVSVITERYNFTVDDFLETIEYYKPQGLDSAIADGMTEICPNVIEALAKRNSANT